jgi:hypothetical protein
VPPSYRRCPQNRGKLTLDADGIPYQPELQPLVIDSFVLTAGGESQLMTFIREGEVYKYLRCRPYLGIRKS